MKQINKNIHVTHLINKLDKYCSDLKNCEIKPLAVEVEVEVCVYLEML